MQRARIDDAGFADQVIFDGEFMADEYQIVLLLVEQSADDLAVIAVDGDDPFSLIFEIGDQPEALDANAVAVAHQPHAVGVLIPPDKAAWHAAERIEYVSSADIAEDPCNKSLTLEQMVQGFDAPECK